MNRPIPGSRTVAPISVVIATLGGESLRDTIEHLNKGTLIPAEILLCIPDEHANSVDGLKFANVQIVRTGFRGQVAQRAEGFRRATNKFVLQLDDDIHVRPTCLSALLASVVADTRVAAGPKLFDTSTGRYHSPLVPEVGGPTRFQKLLYWTINGHAGFAPGMIGKAGVSMGLPEFPGTWAGIDWLPGGCLLHRRENLILEDFYPFAGKAWAEDLFQSRLLKARGIKLVRCGDAECDVNFSSSRFPGVWRFGKDHLEYTRRMTLLARVDGRSVLRLYCYLLLNLVGMAVRRVLHTWRRSQ